MATQSVSPALVRFGDYELDLRTAELRRHGVLVKLQPQPAKVLVTLVSRAGEVVSRQDLVEQVWGSQTFVDFEQGLNFAIRQIRSVLEDDAEHPRYLETLPKRGYRFTAPVSEVTAPTEVQSPATPTPLPRTHKLGSRYILVFPGIAALAVTITLAIGWEPLHKRFWSTSNKHPIESLAVLPLHNLSQDPEQEYFSEGMTDELITDLAKIARLRVISHTSVNRYKETKRPLPEIAQELGVDAVIEGTVLRSGDRVRITAQLIDARTDRHLWAESYERSVKDIFALQGEVAKQIATQVGINLTTGEQARLANIPAVDPAAHEAYLKGNFYWNQLNCTGYKKALEYFQQAVAKDPSFAPAYSGMADSYFNLADERCWPEDDAFAKSKAAALKALELDPGSADAHAQLGELAFYREWDWAKAEKEFTEAIELDPNDAGIHASYAIYLVSMSKQEQGLSEMRKAHELDPVSEATNMMFTYVFYLAHEYDQAIDQAKKTLELHPGSAATYYWLGQCYEKKGLSEEAIAAYLKAMSGLPDEAARLRTAYQRHGLPAFWEEDLQWRKRENKPLDPVVEAMTYSHTGDKDKALERLNLAYQQHSDGLQFLKVEPVYDGVRDDPRFKDLVARLQL